MIIRFIKKYLFPYLFALCFLSISGLFFLDKVLLPIYVSSDELYLPDVRGELLYSGKKILNEKDFRVEVHMIPYNENSNPGTIVKMFPRPFTKIKTNRIIKLSVIDYPEDISIPSLKGLSLRSAKIKLKQFNLKLDTVLSEFNSRYAKDLVSFQTPREGRIVKSGHKVTLGISKGTPPDIYYVPDLIGKSFNTAEKLISSSGLRLGDVKYEYHPDFMPNTVLEQSLTEGMPINVPTKINIILSIDKE